MAVDNVANNAAALVNLLSDKERLMKELIQLLEEERGSIVEMDLPNIELADEKKRELLVKLEDSNNSLRQALRRTATELNLPEEANLSCLLPKVPVQQRAALQGLQTRLLQLGGNLDRVLLFNRELLQGSLRMINRSLGFFNGLFRRSTTYGYAGSMVAAPPDVRLVCKEM